MTRGWKGRREARCPQCHADGRKDSSRERQGSPLPVSPTWLSCQPTVQSRCSSHLSIIPIHGRMGCFIYRELKLDLEKQFWIHLGVRVYR